MEHTAAKIHTGLAWFIFIGSNVQFVLIALARGRLRATVSKDAAIPIAADQTRATSHPHLGTGNILPSPHLGSTSDLSAIGPPAS